MDEEIPSSLRLLAVPAAVVSIALFVVPILLMLSLSVRDPAPGVENFAWMGSSSAVRAIVWSTVRFSIMASLISVTLGFLIAYVIWLARSAMSSALMAIILVSFWLSVLVRCFALILVLGPRGPLNSALEAFSLGSVSLIRNEPGVLIGMVHYLIPFAVLTILTSLRGIDLSLLSAARSLGASRGQVFRTVVLPLASPGLLAALALCTVVALGFYITPALLGGGRVVMLAEFITFHVQNVLAWGKAASLALALIAIIALLYGGLKLVEGGLRSRAIR